MRGEKVKAGVIRRRHRFLQWGQFTAVPVVLARISACKVIRIGLRHEGHSMTWDSGINIG